jgi:two-component system alkaline phosphatase synthesis response regulator PhoP
MKRIFIVDDEEHILEILNYNLTKEGFEVKEFKNGLEVMNNLLDERSDLPDLMILDVMMDKMDGVEVCKKIRDNSKLRSIPIVFLTAKSDEVDKVVGLEMGGDDYMTKPFSVKELISRVKAILRRTSPAEIKESTASKKFLSFKNLKLNTEKIMFFVDDESIKLTKTEFLIIKLFLENIGKIFSRDEIINRVWDDAYVSDRTVDVHIRRLRKKMEKSCDLIQTYSGFGYGLLDN